jgi:Zn-dependent protease
VRVADIDVYVHGTFLLLIAFLAFGDLVAGQGIALVVRSTFLILAVFATVVLHEFGHALTARRFGVRTQDITLLPIGGIARLEKLPDKPGQQLLVSFAGPAVNLAIALAIFVLLFLGNGQVGIESFGYTNGSFLAQLMWINVSLAVFNLLPGYPMDGGRILRALLAMRMPGGVVCEPAPDPDRCLRMAGCPSGAFRLEGESSPCRPIGSSRDDHGLQDRRPD